MTDAEQAKIAKLVKKASRASGVHVRSPETAPKTVFKHAEFLKHMQTIRSADESKDK